MNYNIDFFINKFEKIPERNWCTEAFEDDMRKCANGHCGMTIHTREYEIPTEAKALQVIFSVLKIKSEDFLVVDDLYGPNYSLKAAIINNGKCPEYPQPTPKQRILAALYDIKRMNTKDIDTGGKVKERIVYVTVPETIKQQAEQLLTIQS